MFLVPIHKDSRLQEIIKRPAKIFSFGKNGVDVELIEKTTIVCDTCNRKVAMSQDELENGYAIGYALCDRRYVYEVVCEECRKRYFRKLKIYNNLGLGGV